MSRAHAASLHQRLRNWAQFANSCLTSSRRLQSTGRAVAVGEAVARTSRQTVGCKLARCRGPSRLGDAAEEQFWLGVRETERFFLGDGEVQKALQKLVATLDELGIPYAIVGAMALNEFGHRDVIRIRRLPRERANELNPFVRDNLELWQGVEEAPRE